VIAYGKRKPLVAKKSVKKKTTTKKKKKTPRKKVASKASTARSRSASKKKKTKKKTARKPAARKKTSTKKKAAAKKSTTRKKTSVKKKPAAKKKTVKKAAAKKAAASKKKAPAKKTATKKKSAPKKTVTKKKAAAKTDSKKKKKKKKTTRGRSLGARSVAEAASVAEADAQGYVYINGRRVRMISTKGQTLPRKTRATKVVEPEEDKPKEETKPIKTWLTAKQLRHYRDLLLLKRAELVGDLSAMEEAALQARGGNLSHLPIHMADIGTDTFDQDFNLGLAESERQRLREIDDALMRIVKKTYGVCQMTGKPIPEARLEAKPWAKYTIEAARAIEGQWRG
jgi:RNA polymerase-binding transcription factor DksA